MDGENISAAGRTIGQNRLQRGLVPGVSPTSGHLVSDSSVYTPAMVESVVDVQPGDILIIKTGYYRYGWISPESDEFRCMIKHPRPVTRFCRLVPWKRKSIGWGSVVAMEHPMNTIQRIWHPQTFAEANQKLIDQVRRGLGRDLSAR